MVQVRQRYCLCMMTCAITECVKFRENPDTQQLHIRRVLARSIIALFLQLRHSTSLQASRASAWQQSQT